MVEIISNLLILGIYLLTINNNLVDNWKVKWVKWVKKSWMS